MVTVSPALGGIVDEEKDKLTIIDGDSEDVEDDENEEETDSNDGSGMDKIISDDTFLTFDRNKNYDLTEDISLQNGFDLASSLPPWKLLVVGILLMTVFVILIYIVVVEWNLIKGGKAATNENPTKAAQGIKDSKAVTRAYTGQVIEGAGAIIVVCFLVLMFM